jgi:GAF domain-containing protein
MTEKKSRPRLPRVTTNRDLSAQRDAFMQTFFKKGAQLSDELVRENERLRAHISELDQECTSLRTQLASDDAIRTALRKIEQLEGEKQELLSHIEAEAASSTRFVAQHVQMEQEISSLVNLYVASHQLHSTLDLARVVGLLRELLGQLLGARSYAVYASNITGTELVAITAEGPESESVRTVRVRTEAPPEGAAAVVERVFLTGVQHVVAGEIAHTAPMAACIPMMVDDRVIGAIAIFSLLPHKGGFSEADQELLNMLGAHAGTALTGAALYAQAAGKIPGPEAFGAKR